MSYLQTTYETFANDMVNLVKEFFHEGQFITESEILINIFQLLDENLHIRLHKRINNYKFANKNKRLSIPDKLGYWSLAIGAAGFFAGIFGILMSIL